MQKPIIMFIHGFMGSVEEFNNIDSVMKDYGYKTHSFYMSGHGSNKNKKPNRKNWLNDCEENIEYLIEQGHQKIIIIGHSMGGIMAINLALKYEAFIQKIILFSPAIEYLLRNNGNVEVISNLKEMIKIFEQLDFKKDILKGEKLPLSSFQEFRLLAKEHRNDIYDVKCPIMILQAEEDHIIPAQKIKEIYDELTITDKKFILIEKGSHWCIRKKLGDNIYKEIIKFIKY